MLRKIVAVLNNVVAKWSGSIGRGSRTRTAVLDDRVSIPRCGGSSGAWPATTGGVRPGSTASWPSSASSCPRRPCRGTCPADRRPPSPEKVQTWMTFLRNHKDAIAAMDFFTVPTIRLRVLYCFFVIDHGRHRVLHFNATFNPTSAWVIQQLRDAFPFDTAPRHLIFG